MAARDLIFARNLLVELAIPLEGPSVMWSDSKSAVDMSRDPVAFKMTKHILLHILCAAEFLRDLVARLVIVISKRTRQRVCEEWFGVAMVPAQGRVSTRLHVGEELCTRRVLAGQERE